MCVMAMLRLGTASTCRAQGRSTLCSIVHVKIKKWLHYRAKQVMTYWWPLHVHAGTYQHQ